ncbi:MAG: peptidylprolyl isomerase [Herpetosiphonaceae bacterium]|nr:MAG: peptidylprolyl isomerase [Herpetosiphonaceae bacterium]
MIRLLVAVLGLLLLGGCASVVKSDETQIMATITTRDGDTLIVTLEEFVNNYQRLAPSGSSPDQVFERVVAEKLGLAAARRMGIGVEGSEVDTLLEEIANNTGADFSTYAGFSAFAERYFFESPQDLRRYILEQLTLEKAGLAETGPGQIHARHILFGEGIDPTRPEGEQAEAFRINKELADKAYEELQQGADFATMAAERSSDPGSAQRGGDLGFIARGRTVEPFEQQLFALQEGEISRPVKTQFGWHIIQRLEARADPRATTMWLIELYNEAQAEGRIDVKISPQQAVEGIQPPQQ